MDNSRALRLVIGGSVSALAAFIVISAVVRKVWNPWLGASVIASLVFAALLAWWLTAIRAASRDPSRKQLAIRILFHLSAVFATAVVAWCLLSAFGYLKVILATLLVALFGNLIGTYQRMKSSEWADTNVNPDLAKVQVYLSAAVATIFSGVMVLFFAAGLVQGDLFPNFSNGQNGLWGQSLWNSVAPSDFTSEHFKLFAWSFIAGYVEHFVPTLIEQVAGRRNGEPNGDPNADESAAEIGSGATQRGERAQLNPTKQENADRTARGAQNTSADAEPDT